MIAVAALVAALLAPASAGVSSPRPQASLAVSPPRVALVGKASSTISVTNRGAESLVVDVGRAGFALDLRGRPRIVRRPAAAWLTMRPSRLLLAPGATAPLRVSAVPTRRAEPGDHDALVLLTARAPHRTRVAVRMRIGVLVEVRVPGRIVHRLVLRRLSVLRAGVLELEIANRGNVTEPLGRIRMSIRGRRMRIDPRDLLPRTRGIVQLRYGRAIHGRATVTVQLPRKGVTRAFHVTLP
jgi:hypothetical protein